VLLVVTDTDEFEAEQFDERAAQNNQALGLANFQERSNSDDSFPASLKQLRSGLRTQTKLTRTSSHTIPKTMARASSNTNFSLLGGSFDCGAAALSLWSEATGCGRRGRRRRRCGRRGRNKAAVTG